MPESPKKADPPARPRRRRWLRRLGLTGLFLVVLALFLDGPGSRWILRSLLHSQLDKLGMSGTVEVKGRLHSGYSLEGVHFTGTGPIRLLQAERLAVDYSLFKLIDKQVDRLSGRDISVVLHPEPTAEKPEEPDGPLKLDIPEDLIGDIREIVLPMEIDLGKLSVKIERDGQHSLDFALLGLTHQSNEGGFRITGLASNVLGDKGLRSQDIALGWAPEELSLTRIKVLPRITVESLRIELPAGQPAKAFGKLTLAGASVALEADETGSAKLTLQNDNLRMQDVIADLPDELDPEGTLDELAGTVKTLGLNVENLLARPDEWRGHLQLKAANLRFKRFELEALSAEGKIAPAGIELRTSLGPKKVTELTIRTPLPDDEASPLLANHQVDFELELHALDESLAWVVKALQTDPAKAPPVLPSGSGSISGDLVFDKDGKFSRITADWHTKDLVYDEKTIPPLKGSAKLAGDLAEGDLTLATPAAGESITLTGKANLDERERTYEAEGGCVLPDPSWINALLPDNSKPGESPLWRPVGPVHINWKGSGSFKDKTPKDETPNRHKGSAKIMELALTSPNQSQTAIEATASYEWPGVVTLEPLVIRNGNLTTGGALEWKDGVVTIPGIETSDQTGPLMKLSGTVPLATSVQSLEDFLDQEKQIDLTFVANKFELSRLQNFVEKRIPKGYSAGLETKLRLSGTAARPKLDGKLQILEARVPKPEGLQSGLPPATADLEFATTDDGLLTAVGTLAEPGGEILKLDAELPLKVRDWAAKPESFSQSTFKAHAVSESFDFARLEKFLPRFAGMKGHLGIDVTVAGPVATPGLSGNAAVVIDYYPLPDTPYRQLENTKLLARFEGRRVFLDPSPINIAGGKLILSGEGTLGEEGEGESRRPIFDFSLNLDADHALLWRDDSVSARANAKLTLDGNLKKAKLAGSIDIVESLFYKDIEIIPIGVPATSAPKPKLPKLDAPASGDGSLFPVPPPFGNWELDVKVRTADPILIRGNLASGSILVDAALGGTIANPRPDGRIQLDKIKAALPFSSLEIKKGAIILRPDAPLDPTLDIRGTSSINKRQVSMLVFGPLSNPKYTLGSDPPLPENEILTLVATGSTSSDLEDTSTASMKAFQLMIEEFRRRSQEPGSNELFKRLMKDLENVELRVGENDPFSGRKLSSATLQLSSKYYLSAGVDAEGNPRGVLIYALRFR